MSISSNLAPGKLALPIRVYNIPVREPREGVAFRVRDDSPFEMILIRDPNKPFSDRYVHSDYYAIDPKLYAELTADPVKKQKILDACVPFRFYQAVEEGNQNYFLWPVRLPKEGEKMDPLWADKHAAAELAKKTWIQCVPNAQSN
jgi:hypothetical protein